MRSNSAHRARRTATRAVFLLLLLVSLLSGLAGGLVRAGAGFPGVTGAWLGPAVAAHAFLMICTFMGTVIGIERAVAVKHPLSFAGPVTSAGAGLAVLMHYEVIAYWLVVAASLAFVAVNVAVVRRQWAAHTVLLLVAAGAWAVGSLLHALGFSAGAVIPWWFSFLVLTIAAERLEMTRLMRRRAAASYALYGVFVAMLLGAAASAPSVRWGGLLFGLSLALLSIWLLAFDIARRTIRTQGLSRYMAVCLLLGYLWLLVAGLAWMGSAWGLPLRDAALHGLALGFVFSMMLAHAPVILPAIARVKVLYGWPYYIPLLLLHSSLAVRLFRSTEDFRALTIGATGNGLAIVLFAATVAGSAIAWRVKYSTSTHQHHGVTAEH